MFKIFVQEKTPTLKQLTKTLHGPVKPIYLNWQRTLTLFVRDYTEKQYDRLVKMNERASAMLGRSIKGHAVLWIVPDTENYDTKKKGIELSVDGLAWAYEEDYPNRPKEDMKKFIIDRLKGRGLRGETITKIVNERVDKFVM